MNAPDYTVPRATYRLQLTKDFPFTAAAELAPYLGKLGVSHAYLSPVLKARSGSTHGYDTVDHTVLNPELGTRAEFDAMAARFRDHGLGLILDIVPNHMGVGGDENALWLDVLEWGKKSRYAEWFDINWSPSEPTLKDKVLVPFLGRSFGEAITEGKLELRYDPEQQKFAVWAEGAHKLPVCPDTYGLIASDAADALAAVARLNSANGRNDLLKLIEAQHWRAARYSVAADDINYRRFFIVSDLAAIRVEREDVFDHVHQLTFDLVEQGLVDGLRVDHIDGLFDPKAYCLRLRERCPKPVYLLVEKILAPHEQLRTDWGVDGTTGYEFAATATALLTDPDTETELDRTYYEVTGWSEDFVDAERDAKLEIVDFAMTAELDSLATRLRTLAASSTATADVTRNALRSALREVVAQMGVYRSYVDAGGLSDEDRRNIAVPIAAARDSAPDISPAAFDFVEQAMAGEFGAETGHDPAEVLQVAQRIQQYTGPVMAKGLEDTALYRYNRLIALSDVGERPDRYSVGIDAFHDFNRSRQQHTPFGMLLSSSHDTKRGEDVRARIAALTGVPAQWALAVEQWREMLSDAGAEEVDPNDLYYVFQMLVGALPVGWGDREAIDGDEREAFRQRLDAAVMKSIREARVNTSWTAPNADYEAAISHIVEAAFENAQFMTSLRAFERLIGSAGAQNGLIQTVLKLTAPGVPDIYQGAEFWEQSMVDPDNRRPVDFTARATALGREPSSYADLIAHWRDGRLKQRVIADVLACRSAHPDLFTFGSYEPLVTDPVDRGVCAFVRRHGSEALLVVVRLYPWRQPEWDPVQLSLPDELADKRWRPVIGDAREPVTAVDAPSLLSQLPVAVLGLEP